MALLAASAGGVPAQEPFRPWLPWRTVATENYRFHFPAELESWTRDVAARAERMDSALHALVGHTPERVTHVVVHDPFAISNGYALPMIERPATVWWATPPEPRSDIGNFSTWGELIGVHELAHLAHLTRPSRNPFQRALWRSLPTTLGPLVLKSPRWLYEGYATMLEGRITGSGRPNNAWRPAILRQWAIEGQLPTYTALSGADSYEGGAFAYLNGSAFLEWLTLREGDSALVQVWRRMSARQTRSFSAAFAGVFGESPAVLYGRHAAELTRDAMAAQAALASAGLVEGELVQRLSWETGDPAVTSDGGRVALVLRERTRPARVVVWSTAEEPEDTAALRRRLDALRRDPLDVPDRRFFPRPKKPIATLPALDGRAFQQPRWFPDNRRLLLTRWTPRGDGTVAPELWVWDTETHDVRRLTRGLGVQHGDVAPDGTDAVAVRCGAGRCDVVRVHLATGVHQPLLEGSAAVSYYRPRYSPDGSRIAAARAEGGRWRIVVAARDGSGMRAVDPDDGANRFDAAWIGGDSLVVVSEAGGIANLELLSAGGGAARTLTRVTGAAVAPAVSARDRSIWFLSLHARGLDLRRLPADAAPADSAVSIDMSRYGFAGIARRPAVQLAADSVGESRPYGLGPRHQRWLPGAHASADGYGGFLTIFSGDIIGRLNATVLGAGGTGGVAQGGAVRVSWRGMRPALELGVHGILHEPSLGAHPQPGSEVLDAAISQGVLALSASRAGDGWSAAARAGGSAGTIALQETGPTHFRGVGFGELALGFLQGRGGSLLVERLRVHAAQGHTRGGWQRVVASLELETAGPDLIPFRARGVVGRVLGSAHPYEQFSLGGGEWPVGDSSALSQRHAMPMYPSASASGRTLMAWRLSIPSPTWTAYYEGASAGDSLYAGRRWLRAYGMEVNVDVPPVPVVFAPRVRARVGAAWTVDEPFRRRVRGYVTMQMEP